MKAIRNVNILSYEELPTPQEVRGALQPENPVVELVSNARATIADIFESRDVRYLVVVGPCSIHDQKAALEYAQKLAELAYQVRDSVFIVMRTYFEKPRTSVGWKGFINDPYLDDSFRISDGLYQARELLLKVSSYGIPVGTEALDPITPQYLDDLVSWYAIGARTVESQTHREMASGLSAPVGIKNGTDGGLDVMRNALVSVEKPHHFLGISESGRCTVFQTAGNPHAHGILRGGKVPNYDRESILAAQQVLEEAGLNPNLMVDCSHGNSNKDYRNQGTVVRNLLEQIKGGNRVIRGVMIESNLQPGQQPLSDSGLKGLEYGVSVTDGCIGWEETEQLIREIATSV
ncbi:MAG: 3-deoxy-7-phosphoheptulonate synthase [Bdellovibrionales bacterium]|nr:3-deoxy-7-phosphoheptulonate synthase [Bdellovibrionales bacterium]